MCYWKQLLRTFRLYGTIKKLLCINSKTCQNESLKDRNQKIPGNSQEN